jgi:hypothetical protein
MHAPPSPRTPWVVRIFFVLCAIPLLLVFPYVAAINNPNENVRTYMTMALVERGTLRIDDIVERQGWVNDMAKVPDRHGPGHHYYSVKAPAVSFMALPPYWAFTKVAPRLGHPVPTITSPVEDRAWWLRTATWVNRLFAVQIPCFLFLVWFERYLRAFSPDATLRLSAVAAAGLGTNYVAYTLMFASHALYAVAAFASFGITERAWRLSHGDPRARRARDAFLAGFFAGLSVLLEYHALPVALIFSGFAIVVFRRPTRALAFIGGGMINAVVMMLFQWRAYGNPLTPGHKMVENQKFAAEHAQGVFGILAPSWENVRNLSTDLGFGFFGTSPFMWLGLLAIPFGLFIVSGTARQRRERRTVTAIWLSAMLSMWLINAGAIEWRAGWTIGPRYLGAAPPFFAFGAVCALEALGERDRFARATVRGVAAGLAIASVVSIGLVGLVYNSLPEHITRPFLHFAWPMIRGGFVPHHLGEWFGFTSTALFYVAAACMLIAPIVAVLYRARERFGPFVLRVAIFLFTAFVAIRPALSNPPEGGPPFDVNGFVQVWEPSGRDRLTELRKRAEEPGTPPCLWHQIADIERTLNLVADATRDAARASVPRSSCRRFMP